MEPPEYLHPNAHTLNPLVGLNGSLDQQKQSQIDLSMLHASHAVINIDGYTHPPPAPYSTTPMQDSGEPKEEPPDASPLVGITEPYPMHAESSSHVDGTPNGSKVKPPKDKGTPPPRKKMLWVPPPTYPYNLIPGRDLNAPISIQKVVETTFRDYQPSKQVRKSLPKKKKKLRDSDDDGDEGFDEGEDEGDVRNITVMGRDLANGATGKDNDFDARSDLSPATTKKKEKAKPSAVKQPVAHPPQPQPKPGGRIKTEKARAAEQEKEDRERQKVEKSSSKMLTKTKNGASSSSSKDASGSRARSGSGSQAFASNQGVRVDGARNAVVEEQFFEEEIEEEVVDTHLYCVCKQLYDDDSVMIACDQCDEWYHPKCVDLRDEDLELVDTFICPPCITLHPHLRTTYKVSCVQCRRPARLPLSKFCSDECGIQCVMDRVDNWKATVSSPLEEPNFDPVSDRYLHNPPIKNFDELIGRLQSCSAIRLAKRREGLVSVADSSRYASKDSARNAKQEEEERALKRYRQLLADSSRRRREKIISNAAIDARLALLELAMQRTDVEGFEGRCGYDARVGMDEGEWDSWVESEEGRRGFEGFGESEEEKGREREDLKKWICEGRKKCERHAGWQKLKRADFELEKEVLQRAIQRSKIRERDLCRRIEDIVALRTPPESENGNGDHLSSVFVRNPISADGSHPIANGTAEVSIGQDFPDVEMNGVRKMSLGAEEYRSSSFAPEIKVNAILSPRPDEQVIALLSQPTHPFTVNGVTPSDNGSDPGPGGSPVSIALRLGDPPRNFGNEDVRMDVDMVDSVGSSIEVGSGSGADNGNMSVTSHT